MPVVVGTQVEKYFTQRNVYGSVQLCAGAEKYFPSSVSMRNLNKPWISYSVLLWILFWNTDIRERHLNQRLYRLRQDRQAILQVSCSSG